MISEIAKQRVKEKNDIRKEEIERKEFIQRNKICPECGEDLTLKIEIKKHGGSFFGHKYKKFTYICKEHGIVLENGESLVNPYDF